MSVTSLVDAWRYDGGDPGLVLFGEALKAWRFDLPEGARVRHVASLRAHYGDSPLWVPTAEANG